LLTRDANDNGDGGGGHGGSSGEEPRRYHEREGVPYWLVCDKEKNENLRHQHP
jgi:hypothetical protein